MPGPVWPIVVHCISTVSCFYLVVNVALCYQSAYLGPCIILDKYKPSGSLFCLNKNQYSFEGLEQAVFHLSELQTIKLLVVKFQLRIATSRDLVIWTTFTIQTGHWLLGNSGCCVAFS
jgi:hypothetical protein